MCGILGTINIDRLRKESYKNLMIHRGPDAQLHLEIDNINFYHYRLAIQDLSDQANQPMNYNEYTIIFNGEIYNHHELRKKFNLKCHTSSDTETILQLYHLLGEEMLNEFDGMFAVAIYNKKKEKLFLARDRAGEKPLYFFKKDKKFAFASELIALNTILSLEINHSVINDYFFIGSQFQANTVYKNVFELKNGTFLTIDLKSFEIRENTWWHVIDGFKKKADLSFESAKVEFSKLFDISIKRRLESSDLEVGTFLSGGIDSGLVTAFASKYNKNIKTFTVAFEGAYNEAPLAEKVAKKFNTTLTKIDINFSNLKNDLEKIIINYGEPFMDSSAIPSYYVSQEAKKHVTVILNGDGADELFGGYRRYVPFMKYDFFQNPKFIQVFCRIILKLLPNANNKKSSYNYFHRLLSLSSQNGINTYLSATVDVFTNFEKYFHKQPELREITFLFNRINNELDSGVDKIMCMDFLTLLFGDLLVKMDIATMANSLEGRSPFLSKELLDFGISLDTKYKINGKITKHLLRSVAKDILPIEIFSQPKRGFEIPLKNWINNDFKDITNDYIYSNNAFYKDFVDETFIKNLLSNKVNVSQEKRAKMLYNILCLEIWYKNHKQNSLITSNLN
ncbi:MAG: asparagine synthase (glutamine-hydrolyzing) [Flaviramulus sp.]|nr:asparagine synthase (glutamine-hydrolyzing) [Flaviramulus sp.]